MTLNRMLKQTKKRADGDASPMGKDGNDKNEDVKCEDERHRWRRSDFRKLRTSRARKRSYRAMQNGDDSQGDDSEHIGHEAINNRRHAAPLPPRVRRPPADGDDEPAQQEATAPLLDCGHLLSPLEVAKLLKLRGLCITGYFCCIGTIFSLLFFLAQRRLGLRCRDF